MHHIFAVTINKMSPEIDSYGRLAKVSLIAKRLAAFLIDLTILNFLGRGLSIFFKGYFFQLGGYGFLVGTVIFFVYYAIFESLLTSSASLGKLLLGLRVCAGENSRINAVKCIARSFLVLAPSVTVFYIHFWEDMPESILTFAICFFFVSLIYFQIFFVLVHRGVAVHDYITGTNVVHKAVKPGISPVLQSFKAHDILGLGVVFLGLSLFTMWAQSDRPKWLTVCGKYDMTKLSDVLSHYGQTRVRGSCIGNSGKDGVKHSGLLFNVFANSKNDMNREIIDTLASRLHRAGLLLDDMDGVKFELRYEFDIGIYSHSSKSMKYYSAGEFNSLPDST